MSAEIGSNQKFNEERFQLAKNKLEVIAKKYGFEINDLLYGNSADQDWHLKEMMQTLKKYHREKKLDEVYLDNIVSLNSNEFQHQVRFTQLNGLYHGARIGRPFQPKLGYGEEYVPVFVSIKDYLRVSKEIIAKEKLGNRFK